eukprot:431799-Karenia_brevis.AAC.1
MTREVVVRYLETMPCLAANTCNCRQLCLTRIVHCVCPPVRRRHPIVVRRQPGILHMEGWEREFQRVELQELAQQVYFSREPVAPVFSFSMCLTDFAVTDQISMGFTPSTNALRNALAFFGFAEDLGA